MSDNETDDPGEQRTSDPLETAPLEDPTGAIQAFRPPKSNMPEWIGRYRVNRILGEGAFGRVYLARDDQLDRDVAIKVPHPHLVISQEHVEAYLSEAKTVASLDHPHIVPVHDVGSNDDLPFFVVSKFVKGEDLKSRIKNAHFTIGETAQIIATLAETLHHAHTRGFFHRDVKPGNILIDEGGKSYLVDFGLALRERDVGKGAQYAGTPAYMSPEQARGEGHRVDGRSDVFSLGVVLYELIAGRRPYRADTTSELLNEIRSQDARPPRQINDSIPRELERICLKAMARRAADRYTTALDLAEDLRHFLSESTYATTRIGTPTQADRGALATDQVGDSTRAGQETEANDRAAGSASGLGPLRIVPKGLRSFDVHDADFFLDLLAGARDRNGHPDSIRFWKTRIEEFNPDETFSVGMIYGPSGCGKSSLVKAGLLPLLSDEIEAVYIESTPEDTETRLIRGIRKRCAEIDASLGLPETIASIRQGNGLAAGKKMLIVLDQFEQWLHAKKEDVHTELVESLRQCDGHRVQCIVLVRDDFWLAASRFARELEIRLVDGKNIALVDLFDLDHARKVLAGFGRAFGKLPEDSIHTSTEQQRFLDRSVAGLAEEGKVICVQLALFAEMMKGKSWTSATLKEVGGIRGLGVTFLEETFSSPSASPEHRYHEKAARGVLKALLPKTGTDIKGEMKSNDELLGASGYLSSPSEFDKLIRILDGEVRLITPTEPEGFDDADNIHEHIARHPKPDTRYFQLTHDYLVPSLREWLTHKQKETRRGRAELLLTDRSATWNRARESRNLPSTYE